MDCNFCAVAVTFSPHWGQFLSWAMIVWSGSGCSSLPPPTLPRLLCLFIPSIFDGPMLGLNHEEGGVLEFLLVFLGDGLSFAWSVAANAAVSFWIFSHSSTIKASFASFDSCFKSGSFSISLSNVYLVFLSRGLSNYVFYFPA